MSGIHSRSERRLDFVRKGSSTKSSGAFAADACEAFDGENAAMLDAVGIVVMALRRRDYHFDVAACRALYVFSSAVVAGIIAAAPCRYRLCDGASFYAGHCSIGILNIILSWPRNEMYVNMPFMSAK